MPLFQVKRVLQNAPFSALSSRHLAVEPVEIDTGTAKYDLLLTFLDRSPLAGTLEFATDLFDRSTAEDLLAELKLVLEHAVQDPSVACATLRKLVSLDADARAAFARAELRRAGLAKLQAMRRGRAVEGP